MAGWMRFDGLHLQSGVHLPTAKTLSKSFKFPANKKRAAHFRTALTGRSRCLLSSRFGPEKLTAGYILA